MPLDLHPSTPTTIHNKSLNFTSNKKAEENDPLHLTHTKYTIKNKSQSKCVSLHLIKSKHPNIPIRPRYRKHRVIIREIHRINFTGQIVYSAERFIVVAFVE